MPKHEQAISLSNTDTELALAIGYQAMKNLGWTIQFAGANSILGSTPKNWKTFGQQILLDVQNDTLTITSEMVNGESFDMLGKNKKATAAFVQSFALAKNSIDEATLENNKKAINTLRMATVKAAEQEQQQAEEVDKAMNLSGSNLYITYSIIAINILVFILMLVNGAGFIEPDAAVHAKWGSNYTSLTLSGDWWRLVTNVFIHFGIIHLLMNMYCLYTVGIYLEPMLGKVKFTAAYLCTGVLASLVSLWWHKEGTNSAGASGAVFGMYGLFLALLTTSLIPKQVRQSLLQSIGLFVVYNLVYGLKGGVDNAAHIGGLLSGFVIGYIYAFGIKKEKQQQQLQWIVPAVIIITLGIAYSYLQQNKVSAGERSATLQMLNNAVFKDNEKYNTAINEIAIIEDKATAPLADTTLTDSELKVKIANECLPLWKQAEEKLVLMQGYDVSATMKTKAQKLLDYIKLRRQELDVFNKMIETQQQQDLIPELNKVRDSINIIAAAIQQL